MKRKMVAALFTAVALVGGTFCLNVQAEERPAVEITVDKAAEGEVTIVESGSCGESVSYQLDSEGTLTISGTGGMYSYELSGEGVSPFYNREDIKKVVMDEGVTSIGKYSFYMCVNLSDVTLPSTVTSMNQGAFMYCKGLPNITLPEKITWIGESAFEECDSLKSITIPNGVKIINNSTFSD